MERLTDQDAGVRGSILGRSDKSTAIVALAAVAHGVWVYGETPDYWFLFDFWTHLAESDLDLNDLVRDHGGHWNLWNLLGSNLMHEIGGLEFWPVHGVVWVVSWGIVAIWITHLQYRLVGSTALAVAAGVLALMLGTAYIHKPWLLNIPLGLIAWSGASLMMEGPQNPKRRIAVAALLTLGVTGDSRVFLFCLAGLGTLLVRRPDRFWLPSLLFPAALFATWTAVSSGGPSLGNPIEWSVDLVLSVPWITAHVAASAMSGFVGGPNWVAILAVAVIAVAVVYRALAGILSGFQLRAVSMIVIWSGSVVYSRILTGFSVVESPRYSMELALMLLAGLGSLIRIQAPWAQVGVAGLALAALIPHQVDVRQSGYELETSLSQTLKAEASTGAWLVADGVPYTDDEFIRFQHEGGGTLDFEQVADLVERGWDPAPIDSKIALMQQTMRFDIEPRWDLWGAWCSEATPAVVKLDHDRTNAVASARDQVVALRWVDQVGASGSFELPLDAGIPLGIETVGLTRYQTLELELEYPVCQLEASR